MFSLHPRLAADTRPVTDLPLCRVLLMNDRTYPWLILVPRRPDIREMHRLTGPDQAQLLVELMTVSRVLETHTGALKMNVAALGNMVPQLHIHVVARFEGDAAWPAPVWGKVPAVPYDEAAAAALIHTLAANIQAEMPHVPA
jgi:diadenosine tetraphosphate (Ap4A) HIT family hydrolase